MRVEKRVADVLDLQCVVHMVLPSVVLTPPRFAENALFAVTGQRSRSRGDREDGG